MTYLAFDPDQVAGLAAAMTRSLDELRWVRCADPAALEAMRTVRLLRDELDAQWLPLVHRVVSSTALTGVHVPADLDDLRNSLAFVMAGHGWSVTTDPTSTDVVTAEEARALGARLNGVDAAGMVHDPSQLRWLAARLERIAADPELAASFLSNFHEWAPWGDALGRQRALMIAGYDIRATVTIGDLDAVFAGLAHVQRAVLHDLAAPHSATDLKWLQEMHPYAASMTMRFLGLSGNALGLATQLILFHRPLTGLDALDGPDAADILFPLVADDPAAAEQFLTLAALRPEMLFERAADPAAAFELILQATDPARMSADVAGEIVPRLVDHLALAGVGPDGWRPFLVDLTAPWTLQFSPQNTQWLLTNDQRDRMLAFVLEDQDSLHRFVERADRVTAGFITSLSSGAPHALDELGAFMAMIGELVVNGRMQDTEDRRRGVELVTTLAGLLTTAIPGIAVAAALSVGAIIINSSVAPDPAVAAREAGFGADLAVTSAGAAVAEQIARQWQRDGALPADFPMPPPADADAELPSQDFLISFVRWRASLPGGEFGRLADQVTRHVYAVINPGMMGEHSVTLFMP